mgnify:CR=1 FL=1
MPTRDAILDWLKEPSTARGFGGLLLAAGLADTAQVSSIITAATTILSLVELIRRETARSIDGPPGP